MRLHRLAITALCLLSVPALADEKGEAMVRKWLAAVPKMYPIAVETTTTYTYGKWTAVFKDKLVRAPSIGTFSSHSLSWVDDEFPRGLFNDPLGRNLNPIPYDPDSLRIFSPGSPAQYLGKVAIDGVTYEVVQVNEQVFQRMSPPSRMADSLRSGKDNTLAVKWYFDSEGTLRRIEVEGIPRVPDAEAVASIWLSAAELNALIGPAPRPEKLIVTMTVDKLRKPRTLPERAPMPDSPRTVSISTPGGVQGWAFSPDSRQVAIAGPDQLALFETVTGRRQRSVASSARAKLVNYSADGTRLAFAGADGICVVNTETGVRLHTIPVNNQQLIAMRLSPDGALIATVSGGNEVEVWNAATGVVERKLAHDKPVYAVLISSDGSRLVTQMLNGELVIWDTRNWTIVQRVPVRAFPSPRIAMSRDGKVVATVRDQSIVTLWDISTGTRIRQLRDAAGLISCLEFSPDGRTLSAIDRDERDDAPTWIPGAIRWNIKTGRVMADHAAWRPPGQAEPPRGGILSPDGRLAAFLDRPNENGTVKLVELPKY